jgi:formylglycine-generating enzyme required for sulfatase activity
MNTGHIEAGGNITANDIITGLKIESLTIVLNAVEQLGRQMEQPNLTFRHSQAAGLELAAGDAPLLTVPANVLEAFKLLPRQAADLDPASRHRLYAAWLVTRQPADPPQRVAALKHYVSLSGHTSWDWQEELLGPQLSYLRPTGEGPERRFEREELADVTAAVQRFSAFVLLGPPGCGKSTVLERLAYTTARDYLAGRSPRLPLWVTLAGYHWQRHSPLTFVRERWLTHVADDFVDLARAGRMLLLVDGLNEMPRLDNSDDRAHRAGDWRRLVDEFFAEESELSSRAIIASRDADDYEQRLGLPRVEIDPLSPEQIVPFVRAYLGAESDNFLAELERLALGELAKIPFSLFILTRQYDPARRSLPPNRGQLFAGYAGNLLGVMYPHQDSQRQAALQALAELGFALQETGEGTVLPAAGFIARLPAQVNLPRQRRPVTIEPEQVFERAWRAGLLSLVNEDEDTFKFSHQLLQEQFAARQLLARWQAHEDVTALWRAPRAQAEMPDPDVGEWDPLPPPPSRGWEQTTILAAGLLPQADKFAQAVLAVNPALAGRCLSEGNPAVLAETRAAVQQALLQDLGDPALHRRARIQAGRVLAQVGDPRLTPLELNGVKVILPELVEVPGGAATLGSDDSDAFDNEQPVHQVEVAPFYLARRPVTNAEYGCFIRAGGYDTERYWPPAGWQWRQGQAEESGPVQDWLEYRRLVLDNPKIINQFLNEGRWMPQTADTWRYLISISEEEAREQLVAAFPVKAHTQPHYWNDPAYNSPNQPLVGVTWYEAMAYCAWLTEVLQVTGYEFQVWQENQLETRNLKPETEVRLPTEAEWEWAAGGPQHWPYPWGNRFEADKGNTLEGRILGTSPVGAYPAGAAVCGGLDLSGNVYEWSHTLFQPYPYRADDGREDPLAEGRRALRGGSWVNNRRGARVSSRFINRPDFFHYLIGFRVVVAPVFP